MNNSFAVNIIPPGDPERLTVLERYRLLDTPAEKVFDNITVLAAAMFNVPVALISLVAAETVFFKSTYGVGNVRCADRGESLCALAILSPEVMIFENTLAAPEVADSIPVRQGVRFYAGAPLKTPDGQFIGTVCIADFKSRSFSTSDSILLESLARIVMEQMELRLAAMHQDELQERRLAQKDDFLSVASHELRTPLTTLTGTIQLMERFKADDQPERLANLIGQAARSVRKLNKLVADLLDIKRITTGQVALARGVFEIGPLIEDSCAHIVAEGRHQLRLHGETGLMVFADPQKIEQVLVNLLNNAVKYAPGAEVIDILVIQLDEFAHIAVRDHGEGIPAEHLPRIFERYYRSAGHNVSGLGLGLYIISEIVKQHRGQIGVESIPAEGTTFWFTLPLATAVMGTSDTAK